MDTVNRKIIFIIIIIINGTLRGVFDVHWMVNCCCWWCSTIVHFTRFAIRLALLLECRRRRRGCYTSCARFPIEHDSQNKYFPALVGLSSFNDYCTVQLSVHRLHYYYFLFLYKLWIHIFQFNSKCLELQFIRIFIPDDTQKRAQRLCPGSWWCFPIHPVITINPNNR